MSVAGNPPGAVETRTDRLSHSSPARSSAFVRWHRGVILRIVLWAVGLRVGTALLAFLVNVTFPLYDEEQFTVFGRTDKFWDPFARYDSGWYFGIARFGYAYVEGGRSNLAFFPVYPLMMRYLGRLLGGHPWQYYLAGGLISWAAFVGSMVLFFALARLDLPRRAAERAVLYAAVFPFAFFFGVVYSESVFLFCTLAAFYGLRTRRWLLGGIAGGFQAATRVNGIMAFPAFAATAWRSAGREPRQWGRAGGALVLVGAGFLLWCAYVYSLSGSLIEWAASIQRWDYYPGGSPWHAFSSLLVNLTTRPYAYLTGQRFAPYDTLNGVTALVFIASIPWVWRRFGEGYALYLLANLWLPLSSGKLEGLGRYCAVLFPFFLLIATFKSPTTQMAILGTFAVCYTLCLALFTTIHPLY